MDLMDELIDDEPGEPVPEETLKIRWGGEIVGILEEQPKQETEGYAGIWYPTLGPRAEEFDAKVQALDPREVLERVLLGLSAGFPAQVVGDDGVARPVIIAGFFERLLIALPIRPEGGVN